MLEEDPADGVDGDAFATARRGDALRFKEYATIQEVADMLRRTDVRRSAEIAVRDIQRGTRSMRFLIVRFPTYVFGRVPIQPDELRPASVTFWHEANTWSAPYATEIFVRHGLLEFRFPAGDFVPERHDRPIPGTWHLRLGHQTACVFTGTVHYACQTTTSSAPSRRMDAA